MEKTPPTLSDAGYGTCSTLNRSSGSDEISNTGNDVDETSGEHGDESVHTLAGPSTANGIAMRDQSQSSDMQAAGSASSNARSSSSGSTLPSGSTPSTGESLGITEDLAANFAVEDEIVPPPRPTFHSTPRSQAIQALQQDESGASRPVSHSIPRSQAIQVLQHEGIGRRNSDSQIADGSSTQNSTGGAVGRGLPESRPQPAPRKGSHKSSLEYLQRHVISPVPSPRPSTSISSSTHTAVVDLSGSSGRIPSFSGRSLRSYDGRWETYSRGPFTEPDKAACRAGFYLTQEDSGVLRCHSCQREIRRSAVARLDVWSLHARLSPSCPYMLETQGSEYVAENRLELTEQERRAVIQVTGEGTAAFSHNGNSLPAQSAFSMESMRAALSKSVGAAGQPPDLDLVMGVMSQLVKSNEELKQQLLMTKEEWREQVGEIRNQVNTNEAAVMDIRNRVTVTEETNADLSRSFKDQSREMEHQMSVTSEHDSLIKGNSQRIHEQEELINEVDDYHSLREDELMRGQQELETQWNLDRLEQNQVNRELENVDYQQANAIDSVREESAAAIKDVKKDTKNNTREIKHIKASRLPGIDREAGDYSSDEES